MLKSKKVTEYIIDMIAVLIVIDTFLRFVGVSTVQYSTVNTFDNIFIIVLAADIFHRYRESDDKKNFIRESKLEFISLIPFVKGLRVFRIFRILKKSRLSKIFKSFIELITANSLHYIIFIVLLLTTVGGALLYKVEPRESIPTLIDGIWLSFVTMTTVGYGDYAPITTNGRMISMLIMILGIGFLGVLTGSIATFFTNKSRTKNSGKVKIYTKKCHQCGKLDLSDFSEKEILEIEMFSDYIRSKRKS